MPPEHSLPTSEKAKDIDVYKDPGGVDRVSNVTSTAPNYHPYQNEDSDSKKLKTKKSSASLAQSMTRSTRSLTKKIKDLTNSTFSTGNKSDEFNNMSTGSSSQESIPSAQPEKPKVNFFNQGYDNPIRETQSTIESFSPTAEAGGNGTHSDSDTPKHKNTPLPGSSPLTSVPSLPPDSQIYSGTPPSSYQPSYPLGQSALQGWVNNAEQSDFRHPSCTPFNSQGTDETESTTYSSQQGRLNHDIICEQFGEYMAAITLAWKEDQRKTNSIYNYTKHILQETGIGINKILSERNDTFATHEDELEDIIESTQHNINVINALKEIFENTLKTAKTTLKQTLATDEETDELMDEEGEKEGMTLPTNTTDLPSVNTDPKNSNHESSAPAPPNNITITSNHNQLEEKIDKILSFMMGLDNRVNSLERAKHTPTTPKVHQTAPKPRPQTNAGTPANTVNTAAVVTFAEAAKVGGTTSNAPALTAKINKPQINIKPRNNSDTKSTDIRFVLRFQGRLNQSNQLSIMEIKNRIDSVLKNTTGLTDVRLRYAKWNMNGNLVLAFPPSANVNTLRNIGDPIKNVLGFPAVSIYSQDVAWSKIMISAVATGLTADESGVKGIVHGERHLLNFLIEDNPVFKKLNITQNPRWVKIPETINTTKSSISVAFEDADGSIAQQIIKSDIYFLGDRVKGKLWNDKPLLKVCSNCLSYDHNREGCSRKTRCATCSMQHSTDSHRDKCKDCLREGINISLPCPHPPKCAVCKGNHPFNSTECKTRNRYRVPITSTLASNDNVNMHDD